MSIHSTFPRRPGIGPTRTVYVDPRQTAWVDTWPASFAAERIRTSDRALAEILSRATPPEVCGPEIPVAPARGPMIAVRPQRMEAGPDGRFTRRAAGHEGHRAARTADAFDLMARQARCSHARVVAQARRAHRDAAAQARAAGQAAPVFEAPPFVPPFTTGQVEIARAYAALSERCAASGVRCSSVEAVRGQGAGGGDREAAIFRDFEQLRLWHRRIGPGLAKEVRRIRPGGRKRAAITARHLVDAVCLGGMSLEAVLESCNWAVNQPSREGLRKALCAALERMRGFDLAEGQN
ncbi:hypothetical protein KM176_24230 [Pseudooceanicola sp. CBS1P-1]|uniref:Uncharacterized protein n=1 Tax=Pseudooceanicola albus TaxID=2692189 RepID=A0A6L7GAE3_9RHOB|nr:MULTISPECIES: hypothetical protein [Pseudooceanicola]MBT9386970.1 hypothetical protein [Pseudooceanicola endophyticus]MXN21164.1 hypothetical protein [Pseudooceanicola albus]